MLNEIIYRSMMFDSPSLTQAFHCYIALFMGRNLERHRLRSIKVNLFSLFKFFSFLRGSLFPPKVLSQPPRFK